jgi:acyl-CoA synthetase (AMP-forming)/AMP-acid ligase II
MNTNGRIKIKGRSDDMIIRAGMNIYPQEIEAEVKKDTRTKEVLVYGKRDEKRGSMQIAMKISGDFKSEKEVKDMCITLLPSFQVPEIIELVDSLEKNGSGKIIRKRT